MSYYLTAYWRQQEGEDQPLIHLSRHKSPPAQQMNITLLFIDDPAGVNDTLATGEDGTRMLYSHIHKSANCVDLMDELRLIH